jgi:hypothetical protein
MFICKYIYIYIYICKCICICIYSYRDTISASFSDRLMDISKAIEREKQGFREKCKYVHGQGNEQSPSREREIEEDLSRAISAKRLQKLKSPFNPSTVTPSRSLNNSGKISNPFYPYPLTFPPYIYTIYVYIYINIHIYICICIYIYMYIDQPLTLNLLTLTLQYSPR